MVFHIHILSSYHAYIIYFTPKSLCKKKRTSLSPCTLDDWRFLSEQLFIHKVTHCTLMNLVSCILHLEFLKLYYHSNVHNNGNKLILDLK